MTVRDLYTKMAGDYDEVMSRLMKEERVLKYLNMFTAGNEMNELNEALAADKWEEAFRAVHTLKGVSANLGLKLLCERASVLCEELRPCVKPDRDISDMHAAVQEAYDNCVAAIKEFGSEN